MSDKQSNNLCHCSDKFHLKNDKKNDYENEYKQRFVHPACLGNLKEYDGKLYCLMHAPDENKTKLFEALVRNKIKNQDFNFRGYWFPSNLDNLFDRLVFNYNTSFIGAVFNGKVIFSHSQFDGYASFRHVTFEKETLFRDVIFNGKAVFTIAEFKSDAVFNLSRFNDKTYFYETDFQGKINFTDVRCANYIILKGKILENQQTNELNFPSWNIDMEDSEFEKPEQTIFQDISIKPSAFYSLEPKKFSFINVNWGSIEFTKRYVQNELSTLQHLKTIKQNASLLNPFPLYTRVCRQLAYNAEENSRFDEASNFRKMAFEVERLERKEKRKRWQKSFVETICSDVFCFSFFSNIKTVATKCWDLLKTFPVDFLHFLYRIFSGYGERWLLAFIWLIVIWLFWALIYASPVSNFVEKNNYSVSYWIGYSFNVITLQRPDPKPANTLTMIIVSLEVLFAPLQLALLALAIRRKFMR